MKHIILFLSIIITSENVNAMKLEKHAFKDTIIYSVNFDPKKIDMQIAKALGGGLGKEDVLSIAKRNNAIAAINGSFWESGGKLNGIPAFMLKIRDQIFIQESHYPIAYFGKSGDVEFAKIHPSPKVSINSKTLDCAINMPQSTTPIIIYTRAYGSTTLSNPKTLEITVERDKITKISSEGNATIPEYGFVISANNKKTNMSFQVGMNVILDDTIPENIKVADYIMSGSNMLLVKGQLDEYLTDPHHANTFRDMKHARSALCKIRNGHMAFIATDYVYEDDIKTMTTKQSWEFLQQHGVSREDAMKMSINDLMNTYHNIFSKQKQSKGLSMYDFATSLKEYGCIDAINLDGGSSTTLIYKDKVIAGKKPKLQEDSDAIILKVRK